MASEQQDTRQCEILPDGRRCYTQGKNRIIITEHFPEEGKTLEDLLVDLVLRETETNHSPATFPSDKEQQNA